MTFRLTCQPMPKPKKPPATYMGSVQRVWQQRFPDCNPPASAVRNLRPVYEALSEEEATARLSRYLQETPSQYINLARFAMTHSDYSNETPGLTRPAPKKVQTTYINGKVAPKDSPVVSLGTIVQSVAKAVAVEIDPTTGRYRMREP